MSGEAVRHPAVPVEEAAEFLPVVRVRTVRRWYAEGRGYQSLRALCRSVAVRRIKKEWWAELDRLEKEHDAPHLVEEECPFGFGTYTTYDHSWEPFDRKEALKCYLATRYGEYFYGDEYGGIDMREYEKEVKSLADRLYEELRAAGHQEKVKGDGSG